MKSGTRYEQGDIVLVPFPFTDLSAIKQRPVLILSTNNYNNQAEDVITCGITSNLKDQNYSVFINNENLENGELPTASRIKVDKLFTLNKAIIKKSIGTINKETLIKAKEELVRLF